MKAQLLEVIGEFLISVEGQGIYLRNAEQDASQGQTSFELRAENIPVNDSVENESSFRKSTFALCTYICANGRFRVHATEFFKEDGDHKSQDWEYSGTFDPFHDDPLAAASNILLSYHSLVDEDYISAKIIENVWPRIGREPFRGTYFDMAEARM